MKKYLLGGFLATFLFYPGVSSAEKKQKLVNKGDCVELSAPFRGEGFPGNDGFLSRGNQLLCVPSLPLLYQVDGWCEYHEKDGKISSEEIASAISFRREKNNCNGVGVLERSKRGYYSWLERYWQLVDQADVDSDGFLSRADDFNQDDMITREDRRERLNAPKKRKLKRLRDQRERDWERKRRFFPGEEYAWWDREISSKSL